MALIEKKELQDGFIALWRIEESTEELLRLSSLSPKEQLYYGKFSTEKRRREWLAWHVMARLFIDGDSKADYTPAGLPVLHENTGHISISHSGSIAALYYSSKRCGIDIENPSRDFSKAASRIVSPDELSLAGDVPENEFTCLVWCAKEAVYKFAAREGLDFLKDMKITSVNTESREILVRLLAGAEIRLHYEELEGIIMVFTI